MVNIVKACYKDLDLGKVPAKLWRGFPVLKNKSVFLKPNLVSPHSKWDCCATTHVKIVELMIEKLKQEGVKKIVVGECGFKDQWEKTIKSTQYDLLVKKYGIDLIALQDGANYHKFTLKRAEKYKSLFGVKFSNYLLECDMVINLPKMKVHSMAGMTGAIKNMMGTMAQKGSMHPKGNIEILHKRLCDLYGMTQSMMGFILMDGIIGAEYSEQYGRPVNSQVLISGTDQWSVDVAACKLMGINPEKITYLRYIKKDFSEINVTSSLVKTYELPLNRK